MAKEKHVWEDKKCTKCKKIFTPVNNRHILCGFPCSSPKKKTIEQANAEWIDKGPTKFKSNNLKINLRNYGCRVI